MRFRVGMLFLLIGLFVLVPFASVTFADKGGQPNGGSGSTTNTTGAAESKKPHECDGDPTGNSDTGHGANSGANYDHNCTTDEIGDPSPSGNGQGNAQPPAGTRGQADDKNPPGQAPDATDHNNGYECDGNQGIAKTNPAHTGCPQPALPSTAVSASARSTCQTIVVENVSPANGDIDVFVDGTKVGDSPGSFTVIAGSHAVRVTVDGRTGLSTSLDVGACPKELPGGKTQVLGVKLVAGSSLPSTGGDLLGWLLLSVLLSAIGLMMLSVERGQRLRLAYLTSQTSAGNPSAL